jgi:hypothetical protein
MDEDLKTYLDGKFGEVRTEMQKVEDRSAALIAAEVGSLHTQIQRTEERIISRLEAIDAR